MGEVLYYDKVWQIGKAAPFDVSFTSASNGVGAIAAYNGQLWWLQGPGYGGAPGGPGVPANPTSAIGIYGANPKWAGATGPGAEPGLHRGRRKQRIF